MMQISSSERLATQYSWKVAGYAIVARRKTESITVSIGAETLLGLFCTEVIGAWQPRIFYLVEEVVARLRSF